MADGEPRVARSDSQESARLLAAYEAELVSLGGVRLLSPGTAEIKRMYVDPTARGLGLARRMLVSLEIEKAL